MRLALMRRNKARALAGTGMMMAAQTLGTLLMMLMSCDEEAFSPDKYST